MHSGKQVRVPACSGHCREARAGLQSLPAHRQATAHVLPASRRYALNQAASSKRRAYLGVLGLHEELGCGTDKCCLPLPP